MVKVAPSDVRELTSADGRFESLVPRDECGQRLQNVLLFQNPLN